MAASCNMVPTIPSGIPVSEVNPCPLTGNSMQPCANVCVPIMNVQAECSPGPKPRKKCRYIQPPRIRTCKPDRKFKPPTSKMEDDTIYKKSYSPVEGEKLGAIRPLNNICVGEGKISGNTVNKMSYQPHKDILPPCPILPCRRKMTGDGPMQDLTTQKHDYVPKPFSKPSTIPPRVSLVPSECPLSEKTTNRLSYLPVDVNSVHVGPIFPTNLIPKAKGIIDGSTTQKLSYMPCEIPEQWDKPWARKAMFEPPNRRMEGDTVQKLSYAPPGQYIECDDDCPDGVLCPEEPCFPRAAC